ncbi:Rho GTPase activation protein [Parasitella parasitica]|nr:Rho GTPase activation protein [Parasitella parasitica]
MHSETNYLIVVGSELFGGFLKLEEQGNIPQVIRLCTEQVDKRGLDVVGIYRLSGQTTRIQKSTDDSFFVVHENFTDPEQVDFEQEQDINVITGLLKLYFRELKNPLLTFEYYDRFIEAAKLQDYDERMFRLKSIIQVLPVVNYKVLQYLARHLERVQNNSHINKMEASNLALIFSIGLLRPKNDDLSASIMHNDLLSKVIEAIITNVDWFFDSDIDDDGSSVNNNSSLVL